MRKVIQCAVLIMIFAVTIPAYAAYDLTADELYWIGQKYEDGRNYTKAAEFYTEVIKKDPNYEGIYTIRARSYSNLKNYDLALLDESKAIELSPSNSRLCANRGSTYSHMEKYDLAIKDYTQSIKLADDFYIRMARGNVYVKIHKYDLAMDDFNRMAEQQPTHIYVFIYKSQVYGLLGDYEKAQELSQEGLNRYPDIPILSFILGQSYEKLGKNEEAIDYYQKACDHWFYKQKELQAIKAKIDARLLGDWDSYQDWIYY